MSSPTQTASAPAQPRPPARAVEFAPPPIEVGMTVQWRHGPESEDYAAAFVTGVGNRAVDLLVFVTGYHNGQPRSGVLHEDDPLLKKPGRVAEGCWRHGPIAAALLKLAAELLPPPSREV